MSRFRTQNAATSLSCHLHLAFLPLGGVLNRLCPLEELVHRLRRDLVVDRRVRAVAVVAMLDKQCLNVYNMQRSRIAERIGCTNTVILPSSKRWARCRGLRARSPSLGFVTAFSPVLRSFPNSWRGTRHLGVADPAWGSACVNPPARADRLGRGAGRRLAFVGWGWYCQRIEIVYRAM